MAEFHDMTTPGQGSNSRLNSARMQQGSPDNADRLLAERRTFSLAGRHNDAMQDVYAERAAAREAALEEVRESSETPDEIDPEDLAARIFNRIHAPWL
ncbi:hypothetical protein OG612_18640 [Streptomyces sp. NBC_01527]|uniref:hypothetical protein n=1 Tax=Streptomyces sp. NBC_01527 TaxID=2903894 RepID=UPI00386DD3BD